MNFKYPDSKQKNIKTFASPEEKINVQFDSTRENLYTSLASLLFGIQKKSPGIQGGAVKCNF